MVEAVVVSTAPLEATGKLLADSVAAIVAERGRARMAIPGGSALEAVWPMRARLRGEWASTMLTWVDERCVPGTDEASNRGSARTRGLFGRGPLAELPLWLDGDEPERALERVGDQLRSAFGNALDVVLLGIGEDGHIASLFPGHRAVEATGGVVYVPDAPKPPAARMSLTLDLLSTATSIVLLASGESKRSALHRLIAGDPLLPASRLPRLTVVTNVMGLQIRP